MKFVNGFQMMKDYLLHHMNHQIVKVISIIIILMGLIEIDMIHMELQQELVALLILGRFIHIVQKKRMNILPNQLVTFLRILIHKLFDEQEIKVQ